MKLKTKLCSSLSLLQGNGSGVITHQQSQKITITEEHPDFVLRNSFMNHVLWLFRSLFGFLGVEFNVEQWVN